MSSEPKADSLPVVLVALFKGIVERELQPSIWQALMPAVSRARDYVGILGLELMLDEAEGFAYLRQRPAAEGEDPLPRLVPRRPLSYPVSLMLALLRRRLAEADATGGEVKLVMTRTDIADLVRLYSKETNNEFKLDKRINADIDRVLDLGFLRPMKGQQDTFEVRRILRAFIDAQWLAELLARLEAHAAPIGAGSAEDAAITDGSRA